MLTAKFFIPLDIFSIDVQAHPPASPTNPWFRVGLKVGLRMARATNRLTNLTVKSITTVGRHADGDGLYLVVTPTGTKNWTVFYQWEGKRKEKGLGPVGEKKVSLAAARIAAKKERAKVEEGIDPLLPEPDPDPEPVVVEPTLFGPFALQYIDTIKGSWRGRSTEKSWRRAFEVYATPLWSKPISAVTTEDVMEVLRPQWATHPETADKLRQRIATVLDAAKATGLRQGENPAHWRGHLAHLLPKRSKITKHHPSVPYDELPALWTLLNQSRGVSARALEFTILTTAREGMTLEATWPEIDLPNKLWTIPASRMKLGIEHRIPLCDEALAVLEKVKDGGKWVFPGAKSGRPLSNAAMDMLLRDLKPGYVPHGFRATFKDWAQDTTDHPREIIETAMAHVVGDQTERSYRRTDALAKRRVLMEDWGRFCSQGSLLAPTP